MEVPASVPMSLPPVIVLALEDLAQRDGHRNRSAIVRKLVEREMREQVGADWREEFKRGQVA